MTDNLLGPSCADAADALRRAASRARAAAVVVAEALGPRSKQTARTLRAADALEALATEIASSTAEGRV